MAKISSVVVAAEFPLALAWLLQYAETRLSRNAERLGNDVSSEEDMPVL